MTRHANVRTRHKRRQKRFTPFMEETSLLQLLGVRQNRKTRQRVTLAAADGRGQTPHTATTGAKFGNFLFRKLQNTVGRIGTDSMKGVRLAYAQPLKTIRMVNPIHLLIQNELQL